MMNSNCKIIYICLMLMFLMIFSLGIFAQEIKQEIVVGFGQDILTFDQHNNRTTQDQIAGNLVYETLVTWDHDNNIIPKLATSWEQIDPLTWKFYLRKGVKFHGGAPFTAEIVKFSINRCSEGSQATYTNFVDEVEIIDDHTVLFHLKYAAGNVLENLSCASAAMMNPKFVEEKGEDIVQFVDGTGPYKLEEYTPGLRSVFVKNEAYWGKPHKLDRIEFRTIPEESTRFMALLSGEIDLIENPPPHEIANIEKNKDLYVYISPKNRTLFLGFNLEDKNVGGDENRALREAIAYAVNPDEIVDYVLEGLGVAAHKGFVPESMAKGLNDPSLVRKHDLEKAKQIIKEAGIEPGRTIQFWATKGRYLKDVDIGEVIQSQISKIGIVAEVTVMESSAFFNALTRHTQEMFQAAWGWHANPHHVFYQLFNSESVWNLSAFKDENFDKLLVEASTAVDLNERMDVLNRAYKFLFDDVALIPLLHYTNIYAANKKVKGFYASPEEYAYFDEVYIEE